MNVDFFSVARRGRLDALEALNRRQPELPGFGNSAPPVTLRPAPVVELRHPNAAMLNQQAENRKKRA